MLPEWLKEKLASVPEEGIHGWLFSVARQLHAHMPPDGVASVLIAATANARRPVPRREIDHAVMNSHEVAWRAGDRGGDKGSVGTLNRQAGKCVVPLVSASASRWPARDIISRRCRIADAGADGVKGAHELAARSPSPFGGMGVDDWLDVLFPDAEFLCLAGDHPVSARTRKKEEWSFGEADKCGLIVASPMLAETGKNLDGKVSHRCLENTGPRRWLVIEFDTGTMDEQASLHWHLSRQSQGVDWPSLVVVCFSGSKSLHGWYGPLAEDGEAAARDMMAYAYTLGADSATWTRCQLVRLPCGVRKRERFPGVSWPPNWPIPFENVKQEVFYFNNSPLIPKCLNNNSSAHGVPSVSMPPLALVAQ